MHPAQSPFQQDAIELKGSALTVVVLHLKNSDPRVLYPQLEEAIDGAGSFLASAPVVIDVASLDEPAQETLDFTYLLRFLRGAGLMPVGLQGAANSQKDRVSQAGLLSVATAQKGSLPAPQPESNQVVQERATQENTLLSRERQEPEQQSTPYRQAAQPTPAPRAAGRQAAQRPTTVPPQKAEPRQGSQREPYIEPEIPALSESALVITQPVRAGQQISAPNGDLIVLASVNAGSELFAAGNIHVYGALRGRALAGVKGDTKARIFTLQGNPELLAIAGEYVVNEELPWRAVNQSFAVSWSDSGLRFQVFGSFEP